MRRELYRSWTDLRPQLAKASRAQFASYARMLTRMRKDESFEEAVEQARSSFVESVKGSGRSDKQVLLAAGLVLTDLAVQGWRLRVHKGCVGVSPPKQVLKDRAAEKERIRRQELVKRDAQLRQPAVQKFIRSMEWSRMFDGNFTSIFSLMRDGRELAEGLRKAREGSTNGSTAMLANLVDPYLEFVGSEEATCSFTGLRLMDIWRYFRHTWTNQYTSVPGRMMMFLVRDRAASFHPVVGIGALSSPVMQIRERDTWIGWHPDTFLARVKTEPTLELALWLAHVVDVALAEIYVDDFIEDGILAARDIGNPSDGVIGRLMQDSLEQRRLHHRYVRSRDHKGVRPKAMIKPEYWVSRARMHLFRSKRALAVASYLQLRTVLRAAFADNPTSSKLAALAGTRQGSEAIRKIVRKAKGDRIGIAVADITVCGAVQPYNAILGGKLVAMLATSPEVILEYRRRYASAESEIASSMAGRSIVRTPNLVLLGTTSLYEGGSSQYNRIKIPCDRLDGSPGDAIRYQDLGHSEAFGTSQYSEETVDALADVAQQSTNGQRVNSIFGEGVSPKLRKVRQGLHLSGLPSDLLLRHHRRRVVYGVSLVRKVREYLLGLDQEPDYLVPIANGPAATARIAEFWRERWLRNRIGADEVLAEVERHTLVRPIRHGARVVVPLRSEQRLLFEDPR